MSVPKLRFPEFSGEWEEIKGKEIFDVMGGGAFSSKDSRHNGIKWFKIANVGINKIKSDDVSYLPFEYQKEYEKYLLRKEDIVIALTRPLLSSKLKIALVDDYFDNSLLNQRVGKLIPNKNGIKNFVYYLLQLKKNIAYIENQISGTDPPNLSINDLINIPLMAPSVIEQKKVASFLSKVDEKIEKLEKKQELWETYKKGIMQQIFSQKLRFKDENGENYPDWEETKFSDILFEHKTKSTGNEEVFSVSVHKGLVNQVEHLGRTFAAQDTSKYNLVKPGDIVYTKSPTGDFPLGIIKQSKLDKNVIVSPLYGVFSPINTDLGLILDSYFESPINTKNYLHPIVQKGAKNTMNISNNTFLSRSLILSIHEKEQSQLANFLSTIAKKIEITHKESELVKKFKNGLLQQMFC